MNKRTPRLLFLSGLSRLKAPLYIRYRYFLLKKLFVVEVKSLNYVEYRRYALQRFYVVNCDRRFLTALARCETLFFSSSDAEPKLFFKS